MNIVTRHPKFFWALIVFMVLGSLWEMYPLTNQSLIQEFQDKADHGSLNPAFEKIVQQAKALQAAKPDPTREFSDLLTAIGTNDIQPYFPYNNVRGQENPTYTLLNILQRKAAGKIHLGLDLQGGTEFRVSLDTNHISATDTNHNTVNASEERKRLVSQAITILRSRVDSMGVAEPLITAAGENEISIQLPGLSQAAQDEAKTKIQKAAFLEFRLVHPQNREYLSQQPPIIPPGYEILKMKRKDDAGNVTFTPYLVGKKAAEGLTGKYIKRAGASRDTSGAPEVNIEFDSEGAKKFGKLTTDNNDGFMAIVLDGEIQTAPHIEEPITGGRCRISGGAMDIAEAISTANMLENPLETPVRIDAMNQVSPTLGAASIHKGIWSAVIGTLAVVVFMAVYYHRCGLLADFAMLLNLVITLGIMCSIGSTLSLPGIAGIVLTVGMAVDANVLIYERLREEMALGKSMRGAIAAAYSRAFATIFDSHTTTLISAVILIYMGTGPVKGFGVTLTIGVALSLFTALVVTRLIFDFLLNRGWLNKVGMLHIIKNPEWDFMKWNKLAYLLSAALIVAGMGYGFHLGKKVEGPEFAGGDAVTLSFAHKVEEDNLSSALKSALGSQPEIQYEKGVGAETLKIVSPFGTAATVTNTLAKEFPAAGFSVGGITTVGPSVGEDITRSAVFASFLSLFGILFYVAFRYEFSFSIGAVVAVVHDVFLTLGIFFISGRQLSAPMVAAVLTIIGFSLNDKVVIFDRIREDLKLGLRGTFREIINKAVNQTLSRTIITSGTVFLSTMSLYVFGGGAIKDFAFTFLVGIISGTYSSIYIACALVLWWHKGERPTTAPRAVAESSAATSPSQGAGAARARV
ncbi:MAG: protein translocase subunit SecD [Verrucomicrobiota bacterium]|jgi:SecD/SecF fusion protein